MKKTPVAVIGFVRCDVLEETLARLSDCENALDRDIYVYLSAPRNEEEKSKTKAVFELVKRYQDTALPNIIIIRRDRNDGAGRNIANAVSETVEKTGSAIIIEDDILVSRTFLRYMDAALEYYKDDKRIWCVNAYQNPVLRIPHDYGFDVYFNPRNMAWGWGIWKDRWDAVDFMLRDWPEFKLSKSNLQRLDSVGCDMFSMLENEYRRGANISTWDVQCSYHMVKNGLFAVEPRYSLTKNNGFCKVGSVHCSRPNGIYQKQKFYNYLPELKKFDEVFDSQAKFYNQFRNSVHETNPVKFFVRCVWRIVRWLIGSDNNMPLNVP